MMHKAWNSIEEVLYYFIRSTVKLQGHTAQKNCRFWAKLGVSGLYLQFEFTDGFEMMHKAWCSTEEVPYYFSGSSIKFRGHMLKKRWFESNLSKITRPVAAIKSLRFALLVNARCLTHWGRVTHICVSKLTIIDSDNGLLPDRRQAIIWTNAGLLLIGP